MREANKALKNAQNAQETAGGAPTEDQSKALNSLKAKAKAARTALEAALEAA